MSRATDEWIGANDDSRIPPRVRLRVYERGGGCCQICTRKLFAGEAWEVDHTVALVNREGGNRESNLRLVCTWCHRRKSAQDIAEKSTARRKRSKAIGIKRKSQFQTSRDGPFKQKIGGGIVKR